MDFVLDRLRANPEMEFADVRDAGAATGLMIYPIVYGRAKALLGLVPMAARGAKRRAAEAAVAATAEAEAPEKPRRGPGRPRKEKRDRSPIDSLQEMIDAMRELEAERDRYRDALNRIATILAKL